MRLLESFIITAAILAIPLTSYGWTKTYGGDLRDWGQCVQEINDGGYIIVGSSDFDYWNDKCDLWVLKTNLYGDTVWTRKYGGSRMEFGNFVQQTPDNAFIIVGSKESIEDERSAWILKINSNGDTLWTKTYGDAGEDCAYCVQNTDDGGFIISGEKNNQVGLLRIDSSGDTLWTRQYPYIIGHTVQIAKDGGYIIATKSHSGYPVIFKTDSSGEFLWRYVYDYLEMRAFYFHDIMDGGLFVERSGDDSYVATAQVNYYDGPWSVVWLTKFGDDGFPLWSRYYSLSGNSEDGGKWVIQTSDSGYLIGGAVGNSYGDVLLLKTDSVGDTLWTRSYNGSTGWDWCNSVKQTLDGGYIAVGYLHVDSLGGDLWLLKTNEYGDTVWYEGEPREILEPQEGDTISYMIPAAWFKNTGTYPIGDFYCHCEIWPWSGDSAACAYLSPPYHVKYLVSYSVEPGDSILIKFSEWMCDDSSRYTASFYTSRDEEPIWQTREKSVTFYGEPHVGVIEDQPESSPPSWGLISSCGPKIILEYSNYPQGFSASVFDVAGRKVDEVRACKPSGTVTWGESAPTGVYFIRASGSQAKEVKRFIIMR